MSDPLVISLVLLIIITTVGTFLRRRRRDKCLTAFSNDRVTLEQTDGQKVWGRLRVEITGLELLYPSPHEDKQGHIETSYILYKQEFPKMQAVVRYVDDLDEQGRAKRAKEVRTAYHPSASRRLWRRIANSFNTLRDSLAETANVLIGRAKKSAAIGSLLAPQEKYVSQLKTQLIDSIGTAFEPLLERHIGKRVVIETICGEEVLEYPGVLRDYTADFLSIMDVDYFASKGEAVRKADLVVPRTVGVIRHLGE